MGIPNQKYLLVLVLFLSGLNFTVAKEAKTDSLRQVVAEALAAKNIERLVDHTYELGLQLRKLEAYEECMERCTQALEALREAGHNYRSGDLLLLLGFAQYRLNHYEDALASFMEMKELPTEAFEERSVANAYNNLAKIYQDLGDYNKAYQYNIEVLRIHESNNDSLEIAGSLYGLGSILYYQQNYQDAFDYYQRSLSICEAIGNQKVVYSCLGAIASVYIKTEEYDKALEYSKHSLAIAEELSYRTGVSYALQIIGSIYEGMGNLPEAKRYFLESITIKEEVGDKWSLIGSYLALGRVLNELDRHSESLKYLHRAKGLATEIGSKQRRMEIYEAFAESYGKSGEHRLANMYLHDYIALKDSIITESSVREMGEAKTRYEVQKREDQIALLTTEKALLETEQKIRSLNFYLMGGTLIFFLGLALLWFSRFRMQKRLVGLLEEKNEQIHRQNKQLELSNEDLQQFAYVASHDLKEPLRMISSYTTLLKKRYNQLFDDQAHEFMYYVVDAVDRMQTLLDDLLAYSRVETRGVYHRWVEATDIMAMVTSNLRAASEEKQVDMQVHYHDLPKIKADPSQMVQLFQNLISNAIKFVDTEAPRVEVGFQMVQGRRALYVKDNGIGIDEQSKEKIFDMFHRLHTREEYEGTGIGLATCKRIVDRHLGEIWVESEKGIGSTFFIALPEKAIAQSELNNQPALMG